MAAYDQSLSVVQEAYADRLVAQRQRSDDPVCDHVVYSHGVVAGANCKLSACARIEGYTGHDVVRRHRLADVIAKWHYVVWRVEVVVGWVSHYPECNRVVFVDWVG